MFQPVEGTLSWENPLSMSVCTLVYCSFGSGFPVGVENNHSVPAF